MPPKRKPSTGTDLATLRARHATEMKVLASRHATQKRALAEEREKEEVAVKERFARKAYALDLRHSTEEAQLRSAQYAEVCDEGEAHKKPRLGASTLVLPVPPWSAKADSASIEDDGEEEEEEEEEGGGGGVGGGGGGRRYGASSVSSAPAAAAAAAASSSSFSSSSSAAAAAAPSLARRGALGGSWLANPLTAGYFPLETDACARMFGLPIIEPLGAWRKSHPKAVAANLEARSDLQDDDLKHLRGLKCVRISGCRQLTDAAMQHLCDVVQLDISFCNQQTLTDAGIKQLKRLRLLDMRRVTQPAITAESLKHLKFLKVDALNVSSPRNPARQTAPDQTLTLTQIIPPNITHIVDALQAEPD